MASSSTPVRPVMNMVGFGHPLLDIIGQVHNDYLVNHNVKLGSVDLATPAQLPIFEELSQDRRVEFVPGGASMNTTRVARWMLKSNPDITVSWVGCIGDDEFGCILERALVRDGVMPIFQRQDELQTGTCACMIVDKERSLLANIGAAVEITMDHIKSEDVLGAIENADLFFFEGFFLNTVSSPENSIFIGEHCVARNKVFTYNINAPYLSFAFTERWRIIIPYCDMIFGNREDVYSLGEALKWEEKELRDVIMRLVRYEKKNTRRQRLVVVTGGAESTFVGSVDGVKEYAVPLIDIEEIVDTNAAGDAFVGGFLSQYMLHKPIDTCVAAAHAAAAEIIQHNGCTFGDTPPKIT